MGVCCVDGCETNDNDDVTYFPFPVKPALRRKWRDIIKTSTKLHIDSKVCSKHFNKTDYELIRGKLRLKGRVVPTIFDSGQKDPPGPDTNGTKTPPAPAESTEDVEALCTPEFSLQDCVVNTEDVTENCTIECVPEAILHHDSDSHSETDFHKEDIEDIIANYHIKQNKKIVERLKASQECDQIDNNKQDSEKQVNDAQVNHVQGNDAQVNHAQIKDTKVTESQSKGRIEKEDRLQVKVDEIIEVEEEGFKDSAPVFIEISVDSATLTASDGSPHDRDDCLMVLENVEVDVDPAALMLDHAENDKKDDPISLLTSSDDEDVIIQEPHIDTVEVSDETDEDDMPLVKLVKPQKVKKNKGKKDAAIGKIFWGNLCEYHCFQCSYKTTKYSEFKLHKLEHSKIIQICEICNFTTASKYQFIRHKKKHREEKRFKCHLCEYKARHNMSLIYHLKSHEEVNVTVETIGFNKNLLRKKLNSAFKCHDCKYQTNSKSEMLKHVKHCTGVAKKYSCDKCLYKTPRKSDLRRHKERRHIEFEGDDDDYNP